MTPWPSGVKATVPTATPASNEVSSSPVARLQSRRAPSSDPDIAVLPSGLMATALT
jgi:hypothetical protein